MGLMLPIRWGVTEYYYFKYCLLDIECVRQQKNNPFIRLIVIIIPTLLVRQVCISVLFDQQHSKYPYALIIWVQKLTSTNVIGCLVRTKFFIHFSIFLIQQIILIKQIQLKSTIHSNS